MVSSSAKLLTGGLGDAAAQWRRAILGIEKLPRRGRELTSHG
jgi:hypothetical protein